MDRIRRWILPMIIVLVIIIGGACIIHTIQKKRGPVIEHYDGYTVGLDATGPMR